MKYRLNVIAVRRIRPQSEKCAIGCGFPEEGEIIPAFFLRLSAVNSPNPLAKC